MKKTWKTGWLLNCVLWAGFAVPLDSLDQWKSLKFNKIPQNKVSASKEGLVVAVNKSSSPLVYKFSEPKKISGFKVKAIWKGKLNISKAKVQGEKGFDDFVLKFGIVEVGDETLNWFKRKIAADWILELFKMAPKGSGVRRINFYSTTLQKDLVGKSRTHPLSELLYEERIKYLEGNGEFEMKKNFDQPIESHGLWLSVDGDDTASEFELVITDVSII